MAGLQAAKCSLVDDIDFSRGGMLADVAYQWMSGGKYKF